MENTSRHRNGQTNSVPKEQEGAAYRVTCTPGLYDPDFEYFYARQIFIISDKSGTTSFASRMERRLFLRTAHTIYPGEGYGHCAGRYTGT